jgi:hypothetical protein
MTRVSGTESGSGIGGVVGSPQESTRSAEAPRPSAIAIASRIDAGRALEPARGVEIPNHQPAQIERRADMVPRRARLVGDDRDGPAGEGVEQGGLADVGRADRGDERGRDQPVRSTGVGERIARRVRAPAAGWASSRSTASGLAARASAESMRCSCLVGGLGVAVGVGRG